MDKKYIEKLSGTKDPIFNEAVLKVLDDTARTPDENCINSSREGDQTNMGLTYHKTTSVEVALVCAIDITLEVLLLAQIKAAQREGYEVHGICTEGPNFQFLQSQGIRMCGATVKCSIRPFSDLVVLWRMYRHFKRK